jgi:hypothetical protein
MVQPHDAPAFERPAALWDQQTDRSTSHGTAVTRPPIRRGGLHSGQRVMLVPSLNRAARS